MADCLATDLSVKPYGYRLGSRCARRASEETEEAPPNVKGLALVQKVVIEARPRSDRHYIYGRIRNHNVGGNHSDVGRDFFIHARCIDRDERMRLLISRRIMEVCQPGALDALVFDDNDRSSSFCGSKVNGPPTVWSRRGGCPTGHVARATSRSIRRVTSRWPPLPMTAAR